MDSTRKSMERTEGWDSEIVHLPIYILYLHTSITYIYIERERLPRDGARVCTFQRSICQVIPRAHNELHQMMRLVSVFINACFGLCASSVCMHTRSHTQLSSNKAIQHTHTHTHKKRQLTRKEVHARNKQKTRCQH